MKALLSCFLLWLLAQPSRGAIVTYTSEGPFGIHDGPAFIALTIDIANIVEPVAEVTITFSDLFHRHPADIDALLVGPRGQNVMLMSDVGELLSEGDSIIFNVNLVFRDGAMALPSNTRITSGTYAPTNYAGVVEEIPEMDQDTPAMPPPGPYGTTLSVFNGADPNGTWKLFIQDDLDDDSGTLGSWSITVTTVPEPASALLLLAGSGALLVRRRAHASRDKQGRINRISRIGFGRRSPRAKQPPLASPSRNPLPPRPKIASIPCSKNPVNPKILKSCRNKFAPAPPALIGRFLQSHE